MDPEGFSDDDIDFDQLPQATLDDLEQQARVSTQQQQESRATGKFVRQQPPSSDYGFNDEDVIDLDARPATAFNARYSNRRLDDPVTQREAWRQQRYGVPSRINYPSPKKPNVVEPVRAAPIGTDHSKQSVKLGQEGEIDVESLKARILQLEQDKADLQKSTDDANNFALARAGEICIVRSNLEKTTKEYEKRIAELQKQHNGDAAKAKAELEAARRERDKIETNNKFLEHDLAQEAERARAFKKSLKESGHGDRRNSSQDSPLSTPKKSKILAIRDGFDDDDQVLMVSPSKFKDRHKPTTPKAGVKRKRALQENKAAQSPSLAFSGAPNLNRNDEGLGLLPDDGLRNPIHSASRDRNLAAEKTELMQAVLNHRSGLQYERAVESLSKMTFPSSPERSVSSFLFDRLAAASSKTDMNSCRLCICDVLMSLWSRCCDEQFYNPLYDLTELLQYILMISPSSLSTGVISRLVPLCQQTIDIVALPTAKAAKTPSTAYKSLTLLKEYISPLHCLETLHLTALNCESNSDLKSFWSAMEFDFILLMLHKAQPIDQIVQMLQLLFTSILDQSFGAIFASTTSETQIEEDPSDKDSFAFAAIKQQKQQKNETDILDRLTILLFETPQPQYHPIPQAGQDSSTLFDYERDPDIDVDPSSQQEAPPHHSSSKAIMHLRHTTLSLLYALAETPHGVEILAAHRLAIPRLVRFLHEAILQLYAYFPSSTQNITAQCVSTCVLLLAQLDSANAGADIRGKLAAVPGGLQRWLVALSRTAFAEDVGVAEVGLSVEVCEQAHRILDEMLSPEEGEGVLGVFLSGR